MKRLDIKKQKEALDGISKELPIKFLIVVEKNKQLLSKEYEIIKSISESLYLEQYKEREQKRVDILKKYSNKDSNGEAILLKDRFDIPKSSYEDLEKEIFELDKDYKDVIEKQKIRTKELEEYIEEELDIELFKISLEEFPDELLDKLEELIFLID